MSTRITHDVIEKAVVWLNRFRADLGLPAVELSKSGTGYAVETLGGAKTLILRGAARDVFQQIHAMADALCEVSGLARRPDPATGLMRDTPLGDALGLADER